MISRALHNHALFTTSQTNAGEVSQESSASFEAGTCVDVLGEIARHLYDSRSMFELVLRNSDELESSDRRCR